MQVVDVVTCSYSEFRPWMGTPVRISLGVPKYDIPGFNPDIKLWAATPRWEYFHAEGAEFDRRFVEQCEKIGVEGFLRMFEKLYFETGEKTLVLLCFEVLGAKSHKPVEGLDLVDAEARICHRRVFAKWWLEKTGEIIQEAGSRAQLWTPEDSTGADDTPDNQQGLF